MKNWLRRIRGAVLMGLTWAVVWAPIGVLIGMIVDPDESMDEMWFAVGGYPGFLCGVSPKQTEARPPDALRHRAVAVRLPRYQPAIGLTRLYELRKERYYMGNVGLKDSTAGRCSQ